MAIGINIPSQIEKYLSLALFPATGNEFTLYIANNTNRLYQWDGAAYVEVSQQDSVNWGSIGGDIINQTDLQLALAAKEPAIAAGTTSQYFRGDKTFQTLDKSAVGLGNVDNTSDANKPISTATQTALNAKQNSLGYTPVPETRTLTINGTTQDLSADRTFTISTGITIGTTAITSGTVGRVLFEGTGNVVQESGNLFWDNTNARLGIGTSTPNYILTSLYSTSGQNGIRINGSNASAQTQILLENNLSTNLILGITGSSISAYGATTANQGFIYSTAAITLMSDGSIIKFASGGNAERMRLATTGNVLINTTTDAGFRLDVNGTARVQGNTTVSLNQNLQTSLTVSNTTSGASAASFYNATSSNGSFSFGKNSAAYTSYKILASNDSVIYNATSGDISILNDFSTGRIKFAAGSASTAQMTLFSTGNFAINTTTDAGFRLDVNGTARVVSNTRIGATVYTDVSSGLIIGTTGALNAARGSIASATDYQDFQFINTSIGAGNINAWTFGQRRDTYFGNALGSFQIIGAYYDNTGTSSMVGGGFRVPLICNPNGDIIISGADNSINGKVMIGTKTAGGSKLRVVGLPTSSAGLASGDIWNDAGTLKIV